MDQERIDPSMAPLTETDLRRIESYKAKVLDEKTASGDAEVCSICFEDIKAKKLVRRMPQCKHIFHQK